MIPHSHPILTCEEAKSLEAARFCGDEDQEWGAMQRAGRAVAAAVQRDALEIGGFASKARILLLVGKGHNGGDAIIAAEHLLDRLPDAEVEIVFVFGERALSPLAARAWSALVHRFRERVASVSPAQLKEHYALCLDGIFGFQFRPPVDPRVHALIEAVNKRAIDVRASVDLPSGGLFRADFTYATGSVKTPALAAERAGRLRYLDLGFFAEGAEGRHRVLTSQLLGPLTTLRSPHTDKRTFGHLFVLGGSSSYPGAVMMTVLAAVSSGVGLVTAFVPESLVPAYAARVPEAMWVGWPETPDGELALEGEHLLRERIGRATAVVMGPGLGRRAETLALVTSIVKSVSVPVLLDADALQPDVVKAARTSLVLTPHAGEFARIAGGAELSRYVAETAAVVVLKGPVTQIGAGAHVYHSLFGGPVLARGGSGDLLAGLIGGLLAQKPDDAALAAARGVVWHGIAADLLARERGQVAVSTTELLDFLGAALRAVRMDEV